MAYEEHKPGNSDNQTAAALILPRTPVLVSGTSQPLAQAIASQNQMVVGFTGLGTTPSGAQAMYYLEGDVCQAVAGASMGAGVDVMFPHNGTPSLSQVTALVPAAGASAAIVASGHWVVGQSRTAAGVGEIFSVFVNPRKA